MENKWKYRLSGTAAGLVGGLFGGGGGTVLVPLLTGWCKLEQKRALASCVAVIFPLCALSAVIYLLRTGLRVLTALPYLLGGLAGGFVGAKVGGGSGNKVVIQQVEKSAASDGTGSAAGTAQPAISFAACSASA